MLISLCSACGSRPVGVSTQVSPIMSIEVYAMSSLPVTVPWQGFEVRGFGKLRTLILFRACLCNYCGFVFFTLRFYFPLFKKSVLLGN